MGGSRGEESPSSELVIISVAAVVSVAVEETIEQVDGDDGG